MPSVYAFIGSQTRKSPYFQTANGVGITVCRLDQSDGTLHEVSVFQDLDDPTWLASHATTGMVYAAAAAETGGLLAALRFDAVEGTLHLEGCVETRGRETCHATVAQDGAAAFVVNYGQDLPDDSEVGVMAVAVAAGGVLEDVQFANSLAGSGPNALRQKRSHPHCAVSHPANGQVYVADLGTDLLYRYAPVQTDRGWSEPVVAATLPPGCGPRHLVFTQNGRFGLLVTELLPSIVSHEVMASGDLKHLDRLDLFEVDGIPVQPAGIVFDPVSSSVFVSVRGLDRIVAAHVGSDGALSLIGWWPCGGTTPRDLALSPDGSLLLVCNQDSDRVSIFRIDREPIELIHLSDFPVGTPMATAFMEA